MKQHLQAVVDSVGGWTRLTCPHCHLVMRWRGVDAAEEAQLRRQMADHIKTDH